MEDEPQGQSVSVAHIDAEFVIVSGETRVSGHDITELIEAAHQLGEADPLVLGRGASVSLDLSRTERAGLLAEMKESPALDDELTERYTDLDCSEWEVTALDVGLTIDDLPWGWILPSDPHLLPTGEGEELVVVMAGFQGNSMVGGWIKVGMSRWDNLAAVTWYATEDNTPNISVHYEIEDWNELFLDVVGGFFLYPPCPGDEDCDWDVSIWIDPIFSDETIGEGLTNIWMPCEKHMKHPKHLVIEDVAGRDWRWGEDRWMPG